ncbi:hypothetical protein AALD01_17310 [Oscillospiraceae bacterium 21-37]
MDISTLIQTGIVEAADPDPRRARVRFSEQHSGWLYVLQHPGAKITVEAADGHTHKAALGEWMPKVNEQVLAVYLPVDSGDGFILGVV